MSKSLSYRPEIDGIRTLAIVPVLIYHLKIPFLDGYLLPGGFLGVDVFFVISGFLITQIILSELQKTGTFSIKNFYIRRARRIFPALILMILTSMIAALMLLSPSEMSRFSMSALAAIGFVSNIFWFFALGEYGAQSGLLQPFLHTWSLAIEEQFYLIFPLLLLLIKPTRNPGLALVIIVALCLGSLAASELTTSFNKQLSFFSPVSRAWELMAGSIMAFGLTFFPKAAQPGPWMVWFLPKVSLLVLGLCMFMIDLAQWRHPGVITLPVVLATCAIIWCARPQEGVTQLLSTRLFVFIGRLSYSIYLWHFPIFAFGRLSSVEKPDALDMLAWVALTLAFSVAGYYLVEQRFRFAASGRAFGIALGGSMAVILSFVVVDTTTDLFGKGRTGDLAALYGGEFYDNEILRDQSWGILDGLAGEEESIGTWNADGPSEHERTQLWFEKPDATKVLIIGNSHSKDMFNALYQTYENSDELEVARFGMATKFPADQRQQLFAAPNFTNADVIMISTRYQAQNVENLLQSMISEIQAKGKTVVVVGSTPEFASPGALPMYDWHLRRQGQKIDMEKVNSLAFGSLVSAISQVDTTVEQIAERNAVIYLSRRALVCPKDSNSCTLSTEQNEKTMYDRSHWTLEGAQYFGRKAEAAGWKETLRGAVQ
ncbi:MAG: acyltransferase family protein [Paracoccaceae bacterium]|nr:acyltransferase family protein [Paracoccaceae bacterium]